MGGGGGERKGRGDSFIIISAILVLALCIVNAEPVEDKEALLRFINQVPHYHDINWDKKTSVCSNWTGVTCNPDKSRVIAVHLPGVGFNGQIPANTLGHLTSLELLSLHSNRIKGSFPSDFINLKNLSMLYLQSNAFTSPLPFDFSIWKNLTVIDLSDNRFNGSIPKSMSKLSQLVSLDLANNSLSGEIPDLGLPNLEVLDLSHNNLSGSVPKSLERFPSSSFVGNHVLFLNSSLDSPAKSTNDGSGGSKVEGDGKSNRGGLHGKWMLIIIVVSSVLGVVAFSFLILGCYFRKRKGEEDGFTGKFPKGNMSPEKVISGGQDAKNGLVFFEGCIYAFDLEDLLRASAEVLGKGTFGMSYKAILEDANVVVVKRLKDVSAGKRDFEQLMDMIGNIRHENVVALRAYYYSKDEKLMVNDFCFNGSVSAMLHGNRGEDRIPLDWETRVRIAIGAARGIAHIHTANGGKLVHGNVRSSNIFLNSRQYGCVSDFGLAPVMSPLGPALSRATGYRAPEVTDTRKASQSSDVYSFGVFILELLTGKSPIHTVVGEEHVHLVRWVHSVVREEWTAEVFDIELMRYPNIEEEMVELLQIAMSCVVRFADQRPKMAEIVKMIEGIRHTDAENRSETGTLSRAESQ